MEATVRNETYQFSSDQGDIVVLPSGELGIVSKWELLCVGHVKEVTVFPLFASSLKRFLGFFLGWYRFYDGEINKLRKVGSIIQKAA